MQHTKLPIFIESIKDSVVVINQRGIIQLVNNSICQLLGYEREEMVGNNVSMLMGAPHRAKHDGYIQNYHQTGISKIIGKGRELMAVTKLGGKVPIRLNISELKEEGKILYVGMLYDLSEQKPMEDFLDKTATTLEEELKETNKNLSTSLKELTQNKLKLEQEVLERKLAEEKLRVVQTEITKALEKEKELNELKSRFVSTASHEFRTPLSSILSSAALIERYNTTETNDKRLKHIYRIKSSVNNLTRILNDFLSLSKLEEGKIENKNSLFDLKQVTRAVIDEVEVAAKQGQQIDYVHESKHMMLSSNLQSVKNVMINLISNAIKYSSEGDLIQIRTKIEDNWAVITVKDEGIGIPKEQQSLLFNRFFRADNATTIQGTGLGLHIVKKYLEGLKGNIEFESEENIGTTFIISIPTQGL